MLLNDPKVVLHCRPDVFVCVLPAPVQMGLVDCLQVTIAEERRQRRHYISTAGLICSVDHEIIGFLIKRRATIILKKYI